MKKLFLCIAIMAVAAAAVAQDTLRQSSLKDTYFYNQWVDCDTGKYTGMGFDAHEITERASLYYTADTLQVYGIACGMGLGEENWARYMTFADTTLDSMYCYMRIYVPNGNSLRVVAERRLHLRDSAVSYYYDPIRVDPNGYGWPLVYEMVDPIPVYELYLDQPITVSDTFYVGYEFTKHWQIGTVDDSVIAYNTKYYVKHYEFSCFNERLKQPNTYAFHRANGEWRQVTSWMGRLAFLYAITAPRDSTSHGGGDTPQDPVGIGQADGVSPQVTLQPNPATDEVQVLSNVAMLRIEAYDGGGRRLMDREVGGLKASLDVTRWPSGTYLLRIVTAAGTATRKLVVR